MAAHLEGHVDLTAPEGGESYQAGDTVLITWIELIRHNTLGWDLFFSPDGGSTWDTLKLGLPVEILSYEWVVPEIPTMSGKIRIVQDNENTDYEDASANFTISAISGVRDPLQTLPLTIYPNPMADHVRIEFDNPQHNPYSLAIYDSRGSVVRIITEIATGEVQFERGDLAAGMYFIVLRDAHGIRAHGRLSAE